MHHATQGSSADALQRGGMDAVQRIAQQLHPQLTALRRDLHRHPELAYEEERTSRIVADRLEQLGLQVARGLAGGTGVLAHLPATTAAQDRPAVALRADMDALPITEETGVEHASLREGVMHACGHDGHTAILLGAAETLSQLDHRPNPVTFLFQPAEESGGGGMRMRDEGALDGSILGPAVDRIFGLHGWPQLPLGVVATRPGPIMASTDEFELTIRGRQAHAAQPHLGRDPIVAAAHCVTALQTIVSRNADPLDAAVVTIGAIHAGTASNIIPEEVRMLGTIRALRSALRDELLEAVEKVAQRTAATFSCLAEFHPYEHYPVTVNDEALAERFLALAAATFGAERVERVRAPSMGAEDFAYYCQARPGCFCWLGLAPRDGGESAPLHSPRFDFNDEAIPMGVATLCLAALDEEACTAGC